jgi:hypothetical protein
MYSERTKSIRRIEQRIEEFSDNPLRRQILEAAKNFKTSWIELGRSLYCVWKDRLYKEWGYNNFDMYASKEIGIRKQTAMKLLRSYYFLEKEEPDCLRSQYSDRAKVNTLPTYESIDVLRLAKNKKELSVQDYINLKDEILQKGKQAKDVRKELTALIRQRQELEPEEAREQRRTATLKRFLSVLKSLKEEIKSSKLVSATLIKQTDSLITKLESEIRQ